MTRKLGLIACLWVLIPGLALAQTIQLEYENEPLNDILLDLSDKYGTQIAVNPDIANKCFITIHQSFDSIDLAMKALGARCDLQYTNIEGIYTFYPLPRKADKPSIVQSPRQKPQYLYQGLVVESLTDEPVPYAMIQFGDRGMVADESGRFSFKSIKQSEQGLFKSLGYELTDTLINPSANLKILLSPQLFQLEAIEVLSDNSLRPTNTGEQAGHLSFNDISNNLVPGLSDNLIFNNLRLYPGIMAAGEAISDFVIWGSYAGQNHVSYDDITLFNSWGINDDMGRINPYMIRNVEVYKGAFNVPYGDRIGGVVRMEGTSGNSNKAEYRASLTNQLGNAYINLPLSPSITMQVAARKTLFESFDLASGIDDSADLVVPQYDYSDLNLKLVALLNKTDRLELSAIYSEDDYQGVLQNEVRQNIIQDLRLSSSQSGASLKYIKNWKHGGISSVAVSASDYDPASTANYLLNINQRPIGDTLRSYTWTNPIQEFKASIDHTLSATAKHQAKFNVSFVSNRISLKSNVQQRVIDNDSSQHKRLSAYVLNDFQLTNKLSVQLGLKGDAPLGGELYLQPRINARWDFANRWNVHAGWGQYNQFISKSSVVDELGNRSEIWQLADGELAPVLSSNHSALGISYQTNDLEFGLEGFYKKSRGFSQINFNSDRNLLARELEATTQGLEVFARKQLGAHRLWVSYTLMEVEERPANIPQSVNLARLAPQSQKHEIKAVAILNFSPLQISLTNVYGSGFPNRVTARSEAQFNIYRRMDLSAQYSFNFNQMKIDTGVSILNLFNQRNVRLNQTINSPLGVSINTIGIPFTPTLYLNLSF